MTALAAAIVVAAREDGTPSVVPPSMDSAAPATATAAPSPATAATPAAATTRKEDEDQALLQLPDGSQIAALNGATRCKPLAEAWPVGVPWSPIVGVERSGLGVDWFVHADGTRSTTEMKWRADLARMDAVTRVARPTPRPPTAADGRTPTSR